MATAAERRGKTTAAASAVVMAPNREPSLGSERLLAGADEDAEAASGHGSVRFAEKHFDVTDDCMQLCCILTCPLHFLPLIPGVLGKKTLVLEPEEAVLTSDCRGCCCKITTRRPYGELGSVDALRLCCCVGVSSGLTRGMPMFPGSGCEGDRVDEIVRELQMRMKGRGDTGNIRRLEAQFQETQAMRAELAALRRDVTAIMQHLRVPQPELEPEPEPERPPAAIAMDRH